MGASENTSRYSYLALTRLQARKYRVLAIGKTGGQVNGTEISKSPIATDDVDTVTLYLNPAHQQQYYDYILSLKPRRVIFNPGAENPEFEELLERNGVNAMEACTLVLLSTGQY